MVRCANSAPWIAELSSRARTTPEAVSAMTEAANSYWRARQLVAGDVIRTNLARLAAGERNGGCTAQVRACSSYAIRACRAEQSLYLTWFEPLNIVTTAEHGTKITSAGTGNESTADRGCWNTVTSGDGSSTPCRSAATPVVQGAWYDVLRPLILMQSELSELCEVCSSLTQRTCCIRHASLVQFCNGVLGFRLLLSHIWCACFCRSS